jgi:protein-L-isoaspartate(D-aspartate) O-methyltransferase
MTGAAGALAAGCVTSPARAAVPAPYDWNAAPPTAAKSDFVDWMVKNRGEDRGYLGQRFDRYQQVLAKRDLWDQRDIRAFLLTPREEFVTKANLGRAYEWHYLNIGYGVTITGPHTVARMTNSLNVQLGDKVLEIGNGSGYQSAYLANLTDKVWSIEIIKPLWERTRSLYDSLIERGYTEFKSITTKNADGYYGWEQEAPFDKIISHPGGSHIPPRRSGSSSPTAPRDPGRPDPPRAKIQCSADGTFNTRAPDIYSSAWSPSSIHQLEGETIKGNYGR